jgi:microcystin-dependent protein
MAEPFLGEIKLVGFTFTPRGWADCDGQLLPISQHTALFSLLGTTYGGDGRTTFALPDLRGRVAAHLGQGSGLTNRSQGSRFGSETHTLSVENLPPHSHAATVHCVELVGDTNDAKNNFWSKDAGVMSATYHSGPADATMNSGAVTTQDTGGNQSFTNMQPTLVLRYIIALVGVFPSRS